MSSVQILDHTGRPITAQDTAHYAASRTARDMRAWNPSLNSADADLLFELDTLKARARDLSRNNGVAHGALHTIRDNVVGTGLRLSARPDYRMLGWTKEQADEWARTVESAWLLYADSTDIDAARRQTFAGLTGQVFMSTLDNGEYLALPLWLPGSGRQYATAIQLVDTDRLSNPAGRMDSATLRGGVEINSYGEPVRYWIRKVHPTDWNLRLGAEDGWVGVNARTRFGRRKVLHGVDAERVGQTRGKPLLTSVMAEFKMLGHYQRTELQAAIVNAMIAAFVESSASAEQLSDLFGGNIDRYVQDRNEWHVQLQGGAIIPLHPGDRISAFTPSRPATAFGSFVEASLRNIAAGLNLPYELLLKDFSKTNYSSARAALLEAWRFFMVRRQWLATYWAQPVYELWLEEAIGRGLVEAPGWDDPRMRAAYLRTRWIGPGRGWVDPVKEAQAAKLRMETGISTLEDECAEQGRDWEEVLEQRAREKARAGELGVGGADTTALMQVVPPTDEPAEQDEQGA